MAHQYKNNAVDIFLLDAVAEAESDWLIIKRAWLPMIVWDRVSVVLRVMQGLTLLERFTLKCLLSLGECRSEDLWEIASLPPELTTWLFSILEQKGLASHDQYGVFRPNREASMKALEIRGVPVDRKDTRTVLWFPESEEIVVLKDATSLLTQLRHVLPGRQYPLAQHQKTSRGELINKAIQAGRVYGDEASAVSLAVDDAVPNGDMCPAYACRAVLPFDSRERSQLVAAGYRRRKWQSGAESQHKDGPRCEIIECRLPCQVLPEMGRLWQERLLHVRTSVNQKLDDLGLMSNNGGGQIAASVDEKAARRVSRDRLLVEKIGLEICVANEIEYVVPLHLRPADADAEKLFLLDSAVWQALAAEDGTASLTALCDRSRVAASDLISRLWELRLFRKVYDFRETEDFAT